MIGFVLLLSVCHGDFCQTMPVDKTIYPLEVDCQKALNYVQIRRPSAILECGLVLSDS